MPITVLDPTGESEPEAFRPAPPLATLEGRRVAILDNGKANGDRLLWLVEAILRDRHGVREVVWRRKHDFSRPAPAALLADVAGCDALVTGVGD
jgi:hypothetical protein